ncbi:M10 family metallopeptidase C-terminal domain-containing protein [Bradyrhizobium sp. WSM 1704]|uniref:M10 family metallopeptidase C-terminal domain-containing protein n=1 Tax=Bradyrhizobium semiaridum TaxID=2821404 RepID=UPI001CE3099C|nr:M10 family metallopeptidase C-terminal domain-containing protein [Bradyrhizobium semiaridum]MCA6121865.1 M10 family metallopeptidase C-terminal domain-containing protein [Bradyrhizobium semiaridum]
MFANERSRRIAAKDLSFGHVRLCPFEGDSFRKSSPDTVDLMRKGYGFSDDPETIAFGPWDDTALAAPSSPSAGVAEGPSIFVDPGDPYPLAAGTALTQTTASANSTKPVATTAQLADYLINGFWSYNGELAHHWASNTISFNIDGLNADEQALALAAFAAWHDVANVSFTRTSGAANITFVHTGTMTAMTDASWNGAGNMISATVHISTDWVTTDGGTYDGQSGIDSYAYQTYIHEIGHALGLGHQGPYNGDGDYSTDAIYANDTWQYSIMSYFAEDNYSGSSYRYVLTPQMADIYAVGLIYGAATTTRTGNTVYGFNSALGGVYDFTNFPDGPGLTIYDSGGSDTLDVSGYSDAQTIDLHPGAFSSVGGLVNNVGIATNTVIERAIAGSGNDTLIASDYGSTLVGGAGHDTMIGGAGADRLFAGSGTDVMTGNGGADTFVFATGEVTPVGATHDLITDFASGVDYIDLSGLGTFHFIGSSSLDGNGHEVGYSYNSALGVTTLQGDVNGDASADFAIDLSGNVAITDRDLIGLTRQIVAIGHSESDFDGNGHDDLLWVNDSGVVSVWNDGQLSGAHWIAPAGTIANGWHFAGLGDFNDNGRSDILWVNDNGKVSIWDDSQVSAAHIIAPAGTISSDWHFAGTGDFDGNGRSDILWVNDNGKVSIWDNGQLAGAHIIAPAGTIAGGWHFAGTGDFDGNNHDDILWVNDNGKASIWDNGQVSGAHIIAPPGTLSSGWHFVGTGNFDGNGKSDILWQNNNGAVSLWDDGQISKAHFISSAGAVPSSQQIAAIGDFNGTGRSDILWYDSSGTAIVWDDGQPGTAHTVAALGSGNAAGWHIV